MTDAEVRKLVAVLLGAYPSARMTESTSGVYERMLRDLDYPAANAAVEKLLATSRFMPTVAEIREAVLSLTAGDAPTGGDAWGQVIASVHRYGRNRRPGHDFQFADPVVAHCVKAFGWEEICDSESQTADRARFIEMYEQVQRQARQRQLSDSLPAMKRFRELEAKKAAEKPALQAEVGKLIALVAGKEAP